MAIRKTGAVTGRITQVEGPGMARTAAREAPWGEADDEALEQENQAADEGDD